ncbi:hypothetical protein [uncultured Tateyamaria sp.]|uniref:hypothetical protein n=1 Tax=Tateyamaria sp. 1078 TaxID=3417464 RepID=UPI0026238FBC|nr:hypothetical protein [uncultured Tateyamaria sp.]
MARLIACLLALWASTAQAQAQAQVWQAQSVDGGHFVFHTARAGASVDLICLAPSLQRRPAVEVEQHEIRPMTPGMTRLEIGTDRVPVGNDVIRDDVVLWSDQTGYRLPTITFNELDSMWQVDISATDPLWSALAQARSIILAPGQQQAWQLPVAGLAPALSQVQNDCAAAWSAAQSAPTAAPGTVTVPPQVINRVAQGCGAPVPVPGDAVQAGDLDRDGTPDFVVDWGGIRCPGAMPRPFCGAANCSQMVFLSSRAYVNPIDFLGTSLTITPHYSGALALRITGSFSLCGAQGENCAAPLVWDGTSFVERP